MEKAHFGVQGRIAELQKRSWCSALQASVPQGQSLKKQESFHAGRTHTPAHSCWSRRGGTRLCQRRSLRTCLSMCPTLHSSMARYPHQTVSGDGRNKRMAKTQGVRKRSCSRRRSLPYARPSKKTDGKK